MRQPYCAPISVAPMMDWTDRWCRAFHRLMSRRARLYTEMVTADAVVFGPRDRLIGFDPTEHPVALQLGGSEPGRLAEAARIAADFGYDEINLNCGCPSDRVQSGRFGACLMREPELVAECVAAMAAAVDVPVTVKCRIGVDEQEPRQALFAVAGAVRAAGAAALIVHARKAWLDGLSPKDNRTVPPLDYSLVYELKQASPHWPVILNGGVLGLGAAKAHLAHVDGVMLGRAAYQNPEILLGVDPEIFGEAPPLDDPFAALEAFMPVIAAGLERGERLHDFTRHILGVFAGRPGARLYRRALATEAVRPAAGLDVLRAAIARVARRTATEQAVAWSGAAYSESRAPVGVSDPALQALSRRQDESAALDRIAPQPLEEAHAEQAFLERAGTGDERGDAAHHDRPDRDLVEPDFRRERRAVGGRNRGVEDEVARVDARLAGVGRSQDDHGGAGVEQESDALPVDLSRDCECAADPLVDDHFPASAHLGFGGYEFGRHPVDEIGRLVPVGVDARKQGEHEPPDRERTRHPSDRRRPRAGDEPGEQGHESGAGSDRAVVEAGEGSVLRR